VLEEVKWLVPNSTAMLGEKWKAAHEVSQQFPGSLGQPVRLSFQEENGDAEISKLTRETRGLWDRERKKSQQKKKYEWSSISWYLRGRGRDGDLWWVGGGGGGGLCVKRD